MKSATPLVCDEVVECVGGARVPTVPELDNVAQRIWSDCQGSRSVFRWDDLPLEAPERAKAMRAAHLALIGSIF